MITSVRSLPLSAVRAAWRDLKQDLSAHHSATGFARPRLRVSPDDLAVIIETEAVALGMSWGASVETPLGWGALRLTFPFRRVLQRLGRGEIRRSATMTCQEWTVVQSAARLGLATIVKGDGWEAALTAAGDDALRRGWIP